MADRREYTFDGVRRPQVIPMLGREVEEGQQYFTILRQAVNRLVMFRLVFLGEDIDRYLGQSAARRQVNFAQILLHVRLHRQRDLVQHVRGLMHPAALMRRSGKDLVERLPEAERTVANGDFRGDLQSPSFHIDQQFAPALRAFTYKSNIVWRKIRKDGGSDGRGVGFYFRNITELILFGVKGKNARTDR